MEKNITCIKDKFVLSVETITLNLNFRILLIIGEKTLIHLNSLVFQHGSINLSKISINCVHLTKRKSIFQVILTKNVIRNIYKLCNYVFSHGQ